MKCNVYSLVIIVTLTLLSGCGNKEEMEMNEQTDLNVNQNTQEERKEINKLFVNAENAWIGDVMAFSDENGIYLNYLYETDQNDIAYHPIYRFFTSDFCTFYDEGEVIPYGMELESPDLAVGTGSFIRAMDGTYHCFYTGHNDKADSLGIDKECIMHAKSNDNVNWEKIPEDTFYAPEGYSSNDFRDPFVMWNEEENCYWMLLGAKKDNEEGSCIVKYLSTDLTEWSFEEIFYDNNDLYYMECPDLFQINDWYYLTFSWNNVTYYRMAKTINGPWIKPEIDTFDGNAFYAAKTVEYKGTRYLVGFLDRKKGENDDLAYTWAGSICPYELTQYDDGLLGVKMPSQYMEQYFTKPFICNEIDRSKHVFNDENKLNFIANDEIEYLKYQTLPNSMLLSCTMKINSFSEHAKFGFVFGIEKDALKSYPVMMDFNHSILCYDGYKEDFDSDSDIRNQQSFLFEEDKEYTLKLVVENEVVILYVDDKKVLSNRIYHAVGKDWGFFAQNADVEISNLSLYVPQE